MIFLACYGYLNELFSWLEFCEKEYQDRAYLRDVFSTFNIEHMRLIRVLDLFGGPGRFPGKKIIEIGSQDGVYSSAFADFRGDVIAVDMISKWLRFGRQNDRQIARQHDRREVRWIKAFAEFLPFHDHEFDFIYLGETLEHVVDPEIVLKEAQRVGKRGARIVITVPWVGLKEPTHIHVWPSFKWKFLFEKYISIISSEILEDRWYVVSGIIGVE